jgi:hypothetical protein
MPVKTVFVIGSPDGDPEKHISTIKTAGLEITTVVCEFMNLDQVIRVCKDMVENKGIQTIIVCPAFTHENLGRLANAVGSDVPISVARSDSPGTRRTADFCSEAGWFEESHKED